MFAAGASFLYPRRTGEASCRRDDEHSAPLGTGALFANRLDRRAQQQRDFREESEARTVNSTVPESKHIYSERYPASEIL